MQKTTRTRLTASIVLALVLPLSTWVGLAADSAVLKAGVAVRTVTPDPLLPVSGGVGPSRPAREKKGELTVRALVFEQGNVRVAMGSVDFLGFPTALCEKVRKQVPTIPAENILIGATHTHSAPDCYAFPDGDGRTSADLGYLDKVCRLLADAINEAAASVQAVSLKIATGEAHGKIAYNYYAPELYDPRCHVIQAIRQDGTILATLVNYAIHPEVLGPARGILSPDLVGPLYDRLAGRGAGVGVFINSAQGGMVTADNRAAGDGDARTWEECVRIGNLLADEALRIVAGAPIQAKPLLFSTSRKVSFPIDSPLLLAVTKASPVLRDSVQGKQIAVQVNLVNLGTAQILTIPGEALPNIGFYLKRKMKGEHNLLFGLTNDALGYILTKEDWGSFKRYEYVTRTSIGEMTGELHTQQALRLIRESPAPGEVSTDPSWISLFDGTSLEGWTVKCKPEDRAKQFWKVDQGAILADSLGQKGHDYVWLTTNREYSNFLLRLEFQAFRASPGNSGVQIRSRYDDAEFWLNGPQIDINPPGPWRTGMMWDETRGNQRWIYPDLTKDKWVDESMAKPSRVIYYAEDGDLWNLLEISAIGTQIKATLNGLPITDYDGKGLLDDRLHQDKRVGSTGVIALQIHTGDELKIRFRNIRIKPLY